MTSEMDTSVEITIRLCDVDDIRGHGALLFEEHRQEMEPEAPEVAIDWKRYYEMEERGLLICLGAYVQDDDCYDPALIGYYIGLVCSHPHYRIKLCQHDALYLLPEFRMGCAGLHLIQCATACAQEKGVTRMIWHAKPDSALSSILPRFGYHAEEVVFQKDL